jgi:hypothetical protein
VGSSLVEAVEIEPPAVHPVSRTGIDRNTSKEHEQNAFPDILMTMSQIPDVNRELAEVGAVSAVVDAMRRRRGL